MTRWAYILEKIECVPRNTRWRNDYKWENPLRRKRQEIISPWSFRLGPRMDTSAEQTAPGPPALFFTTHKLSNEDWGKSWNHFWMCLGTTGHCRLQQQRQKTFLTLPMHCFPCSQSWIELGDVVHFRVEETEVQSIIVILIMTRGWQSS